MRKTSSVRRREKRRRRLKIITSCCAFALLIAAVFYIAFGDRLPFGSSSSDSMILDPNTSSSSSEAEDAWRRGFISSDGRTVDIIDAGNEQIGSLVRGTRISYDPDDETFLNYYEIMLNDGTVGYVLSEFVTANYENVVKERSVYVRTAQNLYHEDGITLGTLVNKGEALDVVGYDTVDENGDVNKYMVEYNGETGYIRSEYVTSTLEDATANYDEDGSYQIHAERGNPYGGGDAGSLDFFPREKPSFEDNVMPEECRTLYLCGEAVKSVDDYIELADSTGINAFVVDIVDGTAVSYPSPVMEEYSPTAFARAIFTVEEYQEAIQKIKDAGYYVIGRITAFNDSNLVADYPECAITDNNGEPLSLSRGYWPSAYDRSVWQYKVELAVDAVETMGFNEIQFDYVRFPDGTRSLESAGTIDYNNTYGETKAQAIQRFLMYACDVLHEYGVYVSADVFGEAAYTYVTAYGQYWAAISNVVDVISGMPYPDHFAANGDYLPWTHPYETLNSWAESVVIRQTETASPAIVRTWIQAYNAIRSPYNAYGVHEVTEEIRGLRDAGLTGGYMTWNGSSDISKYRELAEAFNY